MAGKPLQLGKGAWKRTYGKEPQVVLHNRFFEQNPTNREDAVALLSRPGSKFLVGCGSGPIRANFFQDGTLGGKLFTVSGDKFFQFDLDLTRTAIAGTIANSPATPSMAGTNKVWIADGSTLQFWDGVGSRARGTLTFAANPKGGNTVTLGAQTYNYVLQLFNNGAANEVLVGATQADSIQNLVDAINRDLGEGTRYGQNTQVNTSATAVNNKDGTVTAIAKTGGAAGNAVSTLSVLGGAYAAGTLTFTPGVVATQKIQIAGVYYIFTTTPTSAPLADGSNTNPWQVYAPTGADATQALLNLAAALNGTGTAGVTYSTALTHNPSVYGVSSTATTLVVNARSAGTAGNALSTTVPSGAGFAWGGTTLSGGSNGSTGWGATTLAGGVDNALSGVATPDDVGIVSLAVLDGFVLCAAANSDRVYFIRPGEITIDPLDFFTAEAQPDQIISLLTVGDQVWCLGSQTTQAVYLSGDNNAPFSFIQGRAFSQGTVEGTAVVMNQQVVLVGNDMIVYIVAGSPRPISDQGISERIRKALVAERDAP